MSTKASKDGMRQQSHYPSVGGPATGSLGVALVTGGSRGAGRAVALGLGAAGFAVAILGRLAGKLEETRALLERSRVPSVACVADVIDPSAVARSVKVV